MRVTVVIPVYNAAAFVSKAVESAVALNEVVEVLLVEDGSPDDSLQRCEELAQHHAQVRVLRHAGGENKGASAARNLGIRNARCDYVAFLDADDRFTPLRFEREREIFAENPDCDGVYGAVGVTYIDDIGAEAWESKGCDENTLTTMDFSVPPDLLFEYLSGIRGADNYRGHIHLNSMTIKRESLMRSKVRFVESLRMHEDTVFILQLAYKTRLLAGDISRPLAMRSVHVDNRYIHNRNLGATRLLQFRILLAWSVDAGMPERYQRLFADRYVPLLMSTSSRSTVLFRFLLEAVSFRAFRKNVRLEHFWGLFVRVLFG